MSRLRTGLRFQNKKSLGQTTTEYILILAVTVMVALKFRSVFMNRLGTLTERLSTDLDNAEKSAASAS